MKTILILRHAKSSWDNSNISDHDRPLNKRGKRDAPRMGRLIHDKDILPDLIISSTAKRATATAKAVVAACDYDGEIEFTRSFYHADADAFVDRISSLPNQYEIVMVVSHNPGVEELLEDLTGQWERMPTAALAQVDLSISNWSELDDGAEGVLKNFWIPKSTDY
jgi:phosphohistidine phosphatase